MLSIYEHEINKGKMNGQYFFYLYIKVFKCLYDENEDRSEMDRYFEHLDFEELGKAVKILGTQRKKVFELLDEAVSRIKVKIKGV